MKIEDAVVPELDLCHYRDAWCAWLLLGSRGDAFGQQGRLRSSAARFLFRHCPKALDLLMTL
jgi:hypothetical protein